MVPASAWLPPRCIMEPFFTTKPIGEGSGVGLAIANELVKHHRGTLTVAARESQRGTRGLRGDSDRHGARRCLNPPPRRARVLIVDDQLSMAETLCRRFERARGYDAQAIASSRIAAKMLVEEAFDALVTDLRMPRSTAWSYCASRAARCPVDPSSS